MHDTEAKRLAEFSAAVRDSTLKRLKRVPTGAENWAPRPNAMSFADLARHLVDADEWLFRMLQTKDLEPMEGKAGAESITHRDEYLRLIDELERTGRARRDLLDHMTSGQLDQKIHDARFGGPVSAWWVVVRGNLDHEIHHRGEINAYLKMAKAGQATG